MPTPPADPSSTGSPVCQRKKPARITAWWDTVWWPKIDLWEIGAKVGDVEMAVDRQGGLIFGGNYQSGSLRKVDPFLAPGRSIPPAMSILVGRPLNRGQLATLDTCTFSNVSFSNPLSMYFWCI